jgi:hypothetical protein
MNRNAIWVIFGLLFLSGCARVDFYAGEGLNKKTGLRYYIAKPYLLVTRTGAKDKPLDVSIVYLPNLEDPQYAVYHPGWGSHQFSISVSNGILTSYGQTADSKIPETVSALGSLASSAGGASKSIAEALQIFQKQALDRAALDEAAKQLEDIAKDLKNAMDTSDLPITTMQREKGLGLQADLQSLAARLKDPKAMIDLQNIVNRLTELGKDKRWDDLQLQGGPNDNKIQNFNGKVKTLQEQVTAITNKLIPPVPKAEFELYEIKQENGKTILIRVEGVAK